MIAGALGGYVATWPMSRWMEWLDEAKVERPESTLPPRTITMEALTAPAEGPVPESVAQPTTLTAHYGYGMATGCIYPLLVLPKRGMVEAAISGAGYGLTVWVASYCGLLPAVGSSARASNRSARVNGIMISAHLIWGLGLGVTSHLLAGECCDHEARLRGKADFTPG